MRKQSCSCQVRAAFFLSRVQFSTKSEESLDGNIKGIQKLSSRGGNISLTMPNPNSNRQELLTIICLKSKQLQLKKKMRKYSNCSKDNKKQVSKIPKQIIETDPLRKTFLVKDQQNNAFRNNRNKSHEICKYQSATPKPAYCSSLKNQNIQASPLIQNLSCKIRHNVLFRAETRISHESAKSQQALAPSFLKSLKHTKHERQQQNITIPFEVLGQFAPNFKTQYPIEEQTQLQFSIRVQPAVKSWAIEDFEAIRSIGSGVLEAHSLRGRESLTLCASLK